MKELIFTLLICFGIIYCFAKLEWPESTDEFSRPHHNFKGRTE